MSDIWSPLYNPNHYYFMKPKAPIFIVFTMLFVTMTSYGQVGIGTTNPQQELHVAGSSSTIRIDGLNSTNNPVNTGVRNQAVYVNANGDLILPATPAGAELLFSFNDFITTGQHVQTGTGGEGNSIQVYQTAPFILTQDALIMVTYSVSLTFNNRIGSGTVTDGKPKVAHNFFYVGDGTTPNFTTTYGYSGQTYSNNASFGFTPTGFAYNQSTEFIFLTAGTHSLHFYGYVFSGDGTSTSDSFSSYMGASSTDLLKVVALY